MIMKSGFTAVAFLLISTAANAQSAPAGRTSHQMSSPHPRDAQSGMASGKYQRKSGAIHSADFDRNSKENGQTAQTQAPSQEIKKGDNPLYEGGGNSGTNPMYEPSRINSGPKGPVQGQPGQSSRTSGAPLKGVATSAIPRSNKSAVANTPRKHLAGVKYEDRMASGNNTGPDVYQRKHIAGVKYEDRTAPGNGSSTNTRTPAQTPKK